MTDSIYIPQPPKYPVDTQLSNRYPELKYELPKPFIIWILFKGLPSSFDSFISRKYEELAKNINNINVNTLISELISEEARMLAINNNSLEANKAYKGRNRSYCTYCNKSGHIVDKCFNKHPELKNNFQK